MQDDTVITWFSLAERFGGWVALVAFFWFCWRAFMTLARDFSVKVTATLENINASIAQQRTEFAHLVNRVEALHNTVDNTEQAVQNVNRRLEQLAPPRNHKAPQ